MDTSTATSVMQHVAHNMEKGSFSVSSWSEMRAREEDLFALSEPPGEAGGTTAVGGMGLEDLIFSFSGPLPLSRVDHTVCQEIFAQEESGQTESKLQATSLCLPIGSVQAKKGGSDTDS